MAPTAGRTPSRVADETIASSTPTEPDATERPLGRRLRSALVWLYAAQYSGKLLFFVATLILARLLVPSDFALVALVLALIAFLGTSDLGIGQALIWLDRKEAEACRSPVFTLHLIGATALAGLINLLAPLVGTIIEDGRAELAIRLLAIQLILGALGTTHENLLRRELDFRRRFWPDFGGGLVKGVVAVTLALAGAGVWSLVAGQLVGTAARTAFLWAVVPFRPRLSLDFGGRARKLLGFGIPLSLDIILFQLVINVDYVIIGQMIGLTALGYYVIAFRIPELVLHGTLNTLSAAIFPYYARARELGDDVRTRYLGTLRVTALVAAPFVAAIAGLAAPLILLLFGDQWGPAAALMPGLALLLAVDSLAGLAGDIYKAYGRTWLLAGLEGARLILLVPGLILAAHLGGIVAVAWFQAGYMGVVALAKLAVASRVLRMPFWPQLGALAPALAAGTAAGLAGFALTRTMAPLPGVFIGLPVVFLVFGVLCWLLVPEVRATSGRLVSALRPSSAGSGGGA